MRLQLLFITAVLFGFVAAAPAPLMPPFTDIFTALPIPNPADGLGALAGGGGKKSIDDAPAAEY
ncbi:hypothetical protein BKA57DRAFT_540410 [Linnemannia elongata]|nr:hypothetical protein BKA57DRAFT_540410 [Linnemannia elongata]